MRSPSGAWSVAALLALIMLFVPAAHAEEDLVAKLPLTIEGTVTAQAEQATLHWAPDARGTPPRLDTMLHAAEARIVVTNWTQDDRLDCMSVVGAVACDTQGSSGELGSDALRDVTFHIQDLRHDFHLIAFDGAEQGATYDIEATETPLTLDLTAEEHLLSHTDDPDGLDENFERRIDPGHVILSDDALRYEIRGDFTFLLHGARLTTLTPDDTYTYETGTWEERRDVGGTEVSRHRTTQFVQVAVKDAVFTAAVAGGSQDVYAGMEDIVIDIDGALVTEAAAGAIRIGDEAVRSRGDHVRVEGRFTLTPAHVVDAPSKNVYFAMDGEIRALSVGQATYVGGATAIAVAATGATILAAAAAYLWPTIKGGALAPLYAKLTKDKVLDQETRSLVHAKVETDPGVQAQQVAEALDISWTTAAYHLRVLTKMGLIVSKRSGRHDHYFVTGSPAVAGHEVVAAMHNDTLRRIVEIVLREPGIIQKDLSERLGIAASTASGHLNRLRDIGALREEREWKKRRYFAGPALSGVQLHLDVPNMGGADSAVPA